MSEMKALQYTLDRVVQKEKVEHYFDSELHWFIPDGAFLFSATVQPFNPEALTEIEAENFSAIVGLFTIQDTYLTHVDGELKMPSGKITRLVLDAPRQIVYVKSQYLSFFPAGKHNFYWSGVAKTPVFCAEKNTLRLKGLVLPYRMPENYY